MSEPNFRKDDVARLLSESLKSVEWALANTPRQWTHQLPPKAAADSWTPAMNLAHLTTYERCIGLPLLDDMARGGNGTSAIASPFEQSFFADAEKLSIEPIEVIYEEFNDLRTREIAIVNNFPDRDFQLPLTEVFGGASHGASHHSAAWVATKSFQHTWEHGNAILRTMLFSPH